MATDIPDPAFADMTAAELALGLLEGEDRAAALRRVLAEPAFAREVAEWRDRFSAMFASWPESVPSPSVEQRVMMATRAQPQVTTRRFWPVAAIGAIAAALVLTVAIGPQLRRPAPVEPRAPAPVAIAPLLAAIASTSGAAPIAASYDRPSGVIRLAGAVVTPTDRSAELWAINGKNAPQPLGLLTTGSTRIVVAGGQRHALVDGTVLAISIEPKGGSSTGLPTGPVVATGALAAA